MEIQISPPSTANPNQCHLIGSHQLNSLSRAEQRMNASNLVYQKHKQMVIHSSGNVYGTTLTESLSLSYANSIIANSFLHL